MTLIGGIDIGGTKCAVVLGQLDGDEVSIIDKVKFPTPVSSEKTLENLVDALAILLQNESTGELAAIGISCGGPLDSRQGLILSPPNLPGWRHVDVITPFVERFGVPVTLQNDANACALAEWKWGSGRGTRNMVFLTFGTGMGAGLILDNRLYSGTTDMAGEVGHIRLEQDGPVGYGKAGSFEGFCSGGGIARFAQARVKGWLDEKRTLSFCTGYNDIHDITAETLGLAAQNGDELAKEIWQEVGRRLGRGLAILVDLLNPERIVIGSIYARRLDLLEKSAMEELRKESLTMSVSACSVVPALLGENVGDFAALSVASYALGGHSE